MLYFTKVGGAPARENPTSCGNSMSLSREFCGSTASCVHHVPVARRPPASTTARSFSKDVRAVVARTARQDNACAGVLRTSIAAIIARLRQCSGTQTGYCYDHQRIRSKNPVQFTEYRTDNSRMAHARQARHDVFA